MQRKTFLDRIGIILLLVLCSGRVLWASWQPKDVPGLHYPRTARFARLEGTVVVEVVLDRDGKVTDAKAISGQPILAAAARENAKLWKFEMRDEVPGKGNPRLIFVFQLVGECKGQCCEDKFLFSYPSHVEITAPLAQIQ